MTKLYMSRGGQQLAMFPGTKKPRDSHANRGMELENELKVMHALYHKRNLARVEKNFCPTQPLKDGRLAKVIGKAIVDFTGLTAGGRFVAFDAKDCAERRIELNRLAEHQCVYLLNVDALGGMAFVLARFERKYCYKIPIDAWVEADNWRAWGGEFPVRLDGWKPKNRASLTMADMRTDWAVNGVDWLGVLEK